MPRLAPCLKAPAACGSPVVRASFGRGNRSASYLGGNFRVIHYAQIEIARRREGFPAFFGIHAMVMDLSGQMMQATVQLEQPLGDGTRTVGTGFLIAETTPDGKAHVLPVTANHVFDKMPK